MSKYSTLAMLDGATIPCKMAGKQQNKKWNSFEVQCIYKIKGPKFVVKKVKLFIVD